MNEMVPESVFKKSRNIQRFFGNPDDNPTRFECLYDININDLEISPLERTLIIAGIKSYLKQNDFKLSDTTLETLHIQGITENELRAAPNLRCGYEQARASPQCMSIESPIVHAILDHTMTFIGLDSSKYLSSLLLGKARISREGSKFLGQVVLQEPNLLLRIFHSGSIPSDTIFKEITEDHIIQSLKLNPELKKDYIFKVFNVKDLEGLVNVVIRKISQRTRKEEDEFLLEAAVDVLQLKNKIAKIININTNIKNDTKPIWLNQDVNLILLDYLPSQDIISLIEIAIEAVVASQSLNLINTPLSSRQDVRNLEHQMSALGLEDQESSRGSSNRLSVEPLMDGSVKCSIKMKCNELC
ncbi:hypothetical protein [unidentified bacterial endosymbiont]|uniref:hypothetical protein n=1 Tax=unidentified bacterial endosymbiont TaxID=2355 RepID=UPI0020A21942|nr:hypothetical protein [unidentified bacterial endosymbiont]